MVLLGLAENPALPEALMRRMIGLEFAGGQIARRPDLPGSLIAEIMASGDEWLLRALARNPRLSSDTRLRLAAHHDPRVREALAAPALSAPDR
ncbi:hypothetical protein [Catenuloplanes japonicus]|uniref:hypothetical protein n=1 Tax=Catenuloplanes japonicus TaxID=33876 RepID=UPI001E494283|nr:hypothetical protein [Catenuloplanes japonicus]